MALLIPFISLSVCYSMCPHSFYLSVCRLTLCMSVYPSFSVFPLWFGLSVSVFFSHSMSCAFRLSYYVSVFHPLTSVFFLPPSPLHPSLSLSLYVSLFLSLCLSGSIFRLICLSLFVSLSHTLSLDQYHTLKYKKDDITLHVKYDHFIVVFNQLTLLIIDIIIQRK